MRRQALPREAWQYALLLLLLLATATIAVHEFIGYLCEQPELGRDPDKVKTITSIVSAISLGFMALVGAFGVWTIRLAAGRESRRQMGRLVDAMDYLRDGLLAIDARGRIQGANPAARDLIGFDPRGRALHGLISFLKDADVTLLLRGRAPQEVERCQETADGQTRILRFRSQPSEGLTLLLLSDVTEAEAHKERHRRAARLQLIGHLARSVAQDFQRLFGFLSTQATLLARQPALDGRFHETVEALRQEADRGSSMAARLVEMCRPLPPDGEAPQSVSIHLHMAAQTLRDTLPEGWEVRLKAGVSCERVASSIPVEPLTVELGLLTAGVRPSRGTVWVMADEAKAGGFFAVPPPWTHAVVVTRTSGTLPLFSSETDLRPAPHEAGAVGAVLRHLVEEAGGALDHWIGPESTPVFRIRLRGATLESLPATWSPSAPVEWGKYLAGYRVVLVGSADRMASAEGPLRRVGVITERVDTLAGAVARVQESPAPDALLVEGSLLGSREAAALVRAVLGLRPECAVVLTDPVDPAWVTAFRGEVAYEDPVSTPDRTLQALLEARRLARQRSAVLFPAAGERGVVDQSRSAYPRRQ